MQNPESKDFRTIRGYELLKRSKNSLTPAMEDYLEMIYRLCLEDGYTRVGLISRRLQVKPSSASKMIHKLCELGYVLFDRNDGIVLTDSGTDISSYLLYRHGVIESFLQLLGAGDALHETELLEHSFQEDTVERLSGLIAYFERNPSVKQQAEHWINAAGDLRHGKKRG